MRLTIVCGPNGSGKTTLTRHLLREGFFGEYLYVNPDEMLKEASLAPSKENYLVIFKEAERLRHKAIETGHPLLFETVLSTPEKVEFARHAKTCGYWLCMLFLGTQSPEINALYVARRIMDGEHAVPIEKIISRHPKSIHYGQELFSIADEAYIFDNSHIDAPGHLIVVGAHGKILHIADELEIPEWVGTHFIDPFPTGSLPEPFDLSCARAIQTLDLSLKAKE